MRYRRLGTSGVSVSVVGVGCNRFGRTVDLEGVKAIIHRSLDEGINFLDTADVYGGQPGGSEALMGVALDGLWDRVVLGTKVSMKMDDDPNAHGASRYHILAGVEASLKRLKTDHIDLYYIHRWDEHTQIEETMRALEDLTTSGKVRYLGASNFSAWQLCRANAIAEMRGWDEFVAVQSEYHMLQRELEPEVVPYCHYAKMGIVPYFPLAGGLLTGKYRNGEPISPSRTGYVQSMLTETNKPILEQLFTYAEEHGHTPTDLATGWLLGEPQVSSVISGATNADQISANAKASEWVLSHTEMQEVRAILEGKSQP